MPNFSSLDGLEVAEKFLVVGGVGKELFVGKYDFSEGKGII